MKNRAVTIKDIAKALNIAPSTVSRALQDHANISQQTKEKVKKLAEKWNYQPNAMATSLRSNRTKVIGIIVPEITHYFFSTVLSGIEDVAHKAGYRVILTQSSESYEREIGCAKSMLSSRVDGVLVSLSKETTKFDHLRDIKDSGTPIVFFDRMTKEIETDYMVVDDFVGAKNAVDYLIKTGCKRVLFLETSQNLLISQNRKNGYKDALRSHKIAVDNDLIKEADDFDSAYELVKTLLKSGLDFDSIFAVNDASAIGAMAAVKESGKKIPDDISVIGFSGSFISKVCDPTLTTVNQDGYRMGEEAVKVLLGRIEGTMDKEYITKVIKTQLTTKGSTH